MKRSNTRYLVRLVAWMVASTAAAVMAGAPAYAGPPNPDPTKQLTTILGNTTAWLMGILAAVATLFLTVGGVRYLIAGGDPGEIERAKAAFKSAGLGYALA